MEVLSLNRLRQGTDTGLASRVCADGDFMPSTLALTVYYISPSYDRMNMACSKRSPVRNIHNVVQPGGE